MRSKFIFVTGGVLSSLGKGLSAAAIGALLEARGLTVANIKMDPYINVDPGTMSPYQHGEVFVTEDGAETDLDLGHYERFVARPTSQKSNFTTGRVYQSVIRRERKGEYQGHTVQVIPHITDEIKRRIHDAAEGVDVSIIEIGGTVGDIESLPFLEAIRQMRADMGPENVLYIHVTPVFYIKAAGELKTKPTQHSVKDLLSIGIQPDMLVCRSDAPLSQEIRKKISGFCNVSLEDVFSAPDVDNIYRLPLVFHDQNLDDRILLHLGLWAEAPDLSQWEAYMERAALPRKTIQIGIVGKYVHLTDTYKSLNEALIHGGNLAEFKVELVFIDSEELTQDNVSERLEGLNGILIPGGFGSRGIEGKILAARYARTRGVPFFGICLGMQIAVIEFMRHGGGIAHANSREFDPTTDCAVVDMMPEQREVKDLGGTMRLGACPCILRDGTRAQQIYGQAEISERHRHRYEINPEYHARLEALGMCISGTSPDGRLVEMIELPDHPYFVACQFHPEFKSRPLAPHPLFTAFIRAASSPVRGAV